jgi:CRP-like cAMP-binding protein
VGSSGATGPSDAIGRSDGGHADCELAHQIGEHTESSQYCFPLLLTHEEMASMTCTTRETVTRTLGQFRKGGWISIEDSVITLRNPDRLQALMQGPM